LLAQGVQTGTIRGTAGSAGPLGAGRHHHQTSPALLGSRSTMSDTQGYYVIPALPPGSDDVKFELSAATMTARSRPLGLTVDEDDDAAGAHRNGRSYYRAGVHRDAVVGMNFEQPEIDCWRRRAPSHASFAGRHREITQ
jgi:hypothetical protein